jgi:hypothetical protein
MSQQAQIMRSNTHTCIIGKNPARINRESGEVVRCGFLGAFQPKAGTQVAWARSRRRREPGFPLQLLALPRCGVSAAIPRAEEQEKPPATSLNNRTKITTDTL